MKGYSRRQRLALERPAFYDARIQGFTSRDPHARKIRIVSDPTNPKGTKFQLVSILVIDVEDWPMWHASCAFYDNKPGEEYLVPRARWEDWQQRLAGQEIRNLLPAWCRDEDAKLKIDRTRDAVHARVKLTSMERDYMTVVVLGGAKPSVKINDPRIVTI